MDEQHGSRPPLTAKAPADTTTNLPAVRPTAFAPAEIQSTLPTGHTVNDAERLDDLRNKLRRIDGHKNLSARQEHAAIGIIREIASIEGTDGLAELFS
jgi:hypothetical protein